MAQYRQVLHSQQQNQTLFSDPLYCSEENWEDEVPNHSDEQEGSFYISNINNSSQFPILLEQELFWDDEELSFLFSKEIENHLHRNLQTNPFLAGARREAVEWMLKVNAHYSFSPLTAILAVHYFDRFFFSFRLQADKPWVTQLVAVACLSLAAKVEETEVPLLLDLQVDESRYVFEAKTIQRMEILVLSTLKWKMNPVTPLSFLDHLTRRLGLKDRLGWGFLWKCERTILSVISDPRFMCYLPSVMASATMLHVVDGIEPGLRTDYQNQLLGILGIDKDKLVDCSKLIMELEVQSFRGLRSNKRKYAPRSPNAVIDLSFGSESSNLNDSWLVLASSYPFSKKSKAQDQLLQRVKDETADVP